MRKPRAKRAPRGPRVKNLKLTTYGCTCKDCGAKFRYTAKEEPKFCMACTSDQIEFRVHIPKPGEMPYGFAFKMEGDFGPGDFLAAIFRMMGSYAPPSPPPPSRPPTMDRYEAALFLSVHSGCIPKDYILDSPEACERAYKLAARKLHPDAGGSHELFVKLQEAKAALDTQVKGSV
jgi:hypothetical protein